jgi:hypothetical protein
VAHQVAGLDLGDDQAAYVAADFTSIYRVFDKAKYLPTATAPSPDNHSKRKADYDPAAKLAKRDNKTLEEKLLYVDESSADKANPAYNCYRLSGSIGWQRLNVGPEVVIQYGRVHRKTMGTVNEYHTGDAISVHESGDRYTFTAKTNSYEWGEGNRLRYGGGYELHDTLKSDIKRESFSSLALDHHTAFHRRRLEGSRHHEDIVATEYYERAVSAKHVGDYRTATNLHVTWIESPKVFHVVDGDHFEEITGDCWTHVAKKHLHEVVDLYALLAGKVGVEVVGAHATKAGKVMIEAGTLVLKQSAGTQGSGPKAGPKDGAKRLKGTAAGLVADASDYTGAAVSQRGDGTAAVEGTEETKPAIKVETTEPSVSGSGLLIDAMEAEIKTTAALKIKAGSTGDLEAGGPLGIKGVTVKIEGSGPVQIKGAIVQLG